MWVQSFRPPCEDAYRQDRWHCESSGQPTNPYCERSTYFMYLSYSCMARTAVGGVKPLLTGVAGRLPQSLSWRTPCIVLPMLNDDTGHVGHVPLFPILDLPFWLQICSVLTYSTRMASTGCGKKATPVVFCKLLSNRSEYFDETLQLYSLFMLTYKCQILFNYLQIWQNSVISNTTTPRFWRG